MTSKNQEMKEDEQRKKKKKAEEKAKFADWLNVQTHTMKKNKTIFTP